MSEKKNESTGDVTKAQLSAVFAKMPIGTFPKPPLGKVLTVTDTDNMLAAVKRLTGGGVLACPVRDSSVEPGSDWTKEFVGTISMFDLCAFMLETLKKSKGWGKGFEAVMESVSLFALTSVGKIISQGEKEPFLAVSADSSLLDVMLCLGKYKAHRVAVVDKQTLVNLVTQSAVVQALSGLMGTNELIGAHCQKTLKQLGLSAKKTVYSIRDSDEAVEAFRTIVLRKISGVPVVDSEGKIVGNISNRDIRAMVAQPALFDRIYDKAGEFLAEIRKDKAGAEAKEVKGDKHHAHALPKLDQAVCCSESDTLGKVIKTFVELGIHRMYIVDADRKPIGVVSLTDVISTLVVEPAAKSS